MFIPKYRRKVMYGQIKADVREILKKLCEYKGVAIIGGAVCSDHVYMCVSTPPKLSVSQLADYLKGKSALMIFDKHSGLGSKWTKISNEPPYTERYVWWCERTENEVIIFLLLDSQWLGTKVRLCSKRGKHQKRAGGRLK
jgi:REP element-mobilizing transposase RayT